MDLYQQLSKCKVTCTTNNNNNNQFLYSNSHSHNHDAKKTKKVLMKDLFKVKAKAQKLTSENPSVLVHTLTRDYKHSVNTIDTHNLKNVLHKQRISTLGCLPETRKETLEYLRVCIEDPEKCIKIDDKADIVMIYDVNNFKQMTKHAFCDGTFKYCPKFFYQMYSFQIYKDGCYVPVCHFLLPDKKTSTYVKMLKMLKQESGICFENVMLDFEQGMFSALKQVYPGLQLRGCRFHLAQNWWRTIQRYGLAPAYKKKKTV